MTKKSSLLIILFAVSFVFLLAATQQLKAEDTVKCPVSGKVIKKSEAKGTYEYKDTTYYFCCENCKETFIKNPKKILNQPSPEGCSQAEHQHQQEEHKAQEHEGHSQAEQQVQDTAVDPVCGMKVKKADAKATYEYKDKTYYFCMTECKDKFVKNPEKYLQSEEEMVACTVTGEKVKKTNALTQEYEGKTYYFCCPNCKEKFNKDPGKYIK